MPFVSYAQNFEDVMLWRALKHVECGFYIDVGANDPEMDSVTKAFYDRGWRGINIEPVAQWFQRLEEKRPRDINLQIAAGAHQGELVIYELPNTGLSTIGKATAERHETERGFTNLEQVVPVETLTSICQRFHLALIHFLKIDVEGSEKDVLDGLDLSIIRPWIIVVESTLPMTQIEDHMRWDPILCAANYEYVYFDGLNRYYVAYERHDLKPYFNAPPNVFDGFISRQQFASELRAQEAEGKADAAEAHATEAETRAAEAEARATEAETRAAGAAESLRDAELRSHQFHSELMALICSKSWRITKPLREVVRQIKRLQEAVQYLLWIFVVRSKSLVVSMLVLAENLINRRPVVKNLLLRILNKFPGIKLRIALVLMSKSKPELIWSSTAGLSHDPRLAKFEKLVASALNEIKKEQKS